MMAAHDWMADGWGGGRPFTECGNGSKPESTANIRRVLPEWTARYAIRTVADAGAGDLQWRAGLAWDVIYRPYDLFPRHPDVVRWDVASGLLPFADLILCRMVLNHLDERTATRALELFAIAGQYLAATTFAGGGPQRSDTFRRYDLTRWMGEPIESVQDGAEENCRLALWRL